MISSGYCQCLQIYNQFCSGYQCQFKAQEINLAQKREMVLDNKLRFQALLYEIDVQSHSKKPFTNGNKFLEIIEKIWFFEGPKTFLNGFKYASF